MELTEFTNKLDEDFAWRKKELSNLLLLANSDNENLIVKSMILMIYSHWEGFVKNTCKLYLKYVSDLEKNLSDLSLNFEAIAIKSKIKSLASSMDSPTLTNELALLDAIYGVDQLKFTIDKSILRDKEKSIINTQSNLKFDIFSSFLKITGIGDRNCIRSKKHYIDSVLLNNRNIIAHGSKINGETFNVSLSDIKNLRDTMFFIMECLSDDLQHYAENELYLYKHEHIRLKYNTKSNERLEKKLSSI